MQRDVVLILEPRVRHGGLEQGVRRLGMFGKTRDDLFEAEHGVGKESPRVQAFGPPVQGIGQELAGRMGFDERGKGFFPFAEAFLMIEAEGLIIGGLFARRHFGRRGGCRCSARAARRKRHHRGRRHGLGRVRRRGRCPRAVCCTDCARRLFGAFGRCRHLFRSRIKPCLGVCLFRAAGDQSPTHKERCRSQSRLFPHSLHVSSTVSRVANPRRLEVFFQALFGSPVTLLSAVRGCVQ